MSIRLELYHRLKKMYSNTPAWRRNFSMSSLRRAIVGQSNASNTSVGGGVGATSRKSSKSEGQESDVKKIRNIGIIAHIDAGKTTTTERMLYYCGFTKAMGDVDSGSTVTDYMEQERERGITISSAAITFYYNQHRLNLIDTPGHVDFTLEVERCLRVLDGAVTILDASAGVEAQTVTVWRQARHFGIPSIVYLNKMDKPGANVDQCLNSIKEKLRIDPVLIQRPLGDGKSFRGVADLIRMETLEWPSETDGKKFNRKKLEPSQPDFEQFQRDRRSMIDKIAEHDDRLAELILNPQSTSSSSSSDDPYARLNAEDLVAALRRSVLARRLVPTLCGASAKNKGVQPLVESVCNFLPSPDEREHEFLQHYGESELVALVFKIIHDPHHGALTFVRVYNGRVAGGMKIYNATRNELEVIQRVYLAHSDEMEDVREVTAGNIAVIPGLKSAFTGDTIVESEQAARRAAGKFEKSTKKRASSKIKSDDGVLNEIDTNQCNDDGRLVLAGIRTPEPVFFCSIESPSYGRQEAFENALRALAREDPSLRFRDDPESQQTIMEGMGHLHIEIVKDRLLREYKLDVFLGPLQINYREGIEREAEVFHTLKDQVVKEQTRKEVYEVTMALRVEPTLPGQGRLKRLKLRRDGDGETELTTIPQRYIDAIFEACLHTCANGPLLGRPVQDLEVTLLELATSRRCPSTLVGACASVCLTRALNEAGVHLIEPIVRLETNVPETHYAVVSGDLMRRRGEILDTKSNLEEKSRTIYARVPLGKMIDFVSVLRRSTSGAGTMHMEVEGYAKVPPEETRAIVQQVTGLGR